MSIFQKISWIRLLNTFNKARTRCPIVFYEKIIAVFQIKRDQIDAENDKKPEMSQFSTFLTSFCQVFNRLRGLEC